MEIKIRAEDMLDVLTKHSMDIVEAKAIVCDLILRADPEYVKRQHIREASRLLREERKEETEQAAVDAKLGENAEDEISYTPRKGKRISFAAFGGNDSMVGTSK
jgi:hypothetical protein